MTDNKEIKITWNEDGINIHIEGGVAHWEALGVIEYAKQDILNRMEVDYL